MASQFPTLFQQYYVIHETISALLGKDSSGAINENEIERRIKTLHPDLQMSPALLKSALRQALKDTETTVGGRPQRKVPVSAGHLNTSVPGSDR